MGQLPIPQNIDAGATAEKNAEERVTQGITKCREADDSILFIDASQKFEIIKTLEASMTKNNINEIEPVANFPSSQEDIYLPFF